MEMNGEEKSEKSIAQSLNMLKINLIDLIGKEKVLQYARWERVMDSETEDEIK